MKKRYPGDGYYYVICDVCGFKVRAKDTQKINDKYNTLNGLIVCKDDVEKTNPQQYLKGRKERPAPTYSRPEIPDNFGFIHTASEIETGDLSNPTGRTPSAPTGLKIESYSTTSRVLTWQPAADTGSSTATGYRLVRRAYIGAAEIPYSTTTINTSSSARRYTDDETILDIYNYTYTVAVINRDGVGTASPETPRITLS